MRFYLGTLLLLFCLLVLPTGALLACGNGDANHMEKCDQKSSNSCCSKGLAQTRLNGNSKHQHSGHDCPCDHKNDGCHCSGCGMISCSGAAFAGETPPMFFIISPLGSSVQKLAFYFAGHLPEDVYLTIFQPPKVSV